MTKFICFPINYNKILEKFESLPGPDFKVHKLVNPDFYTNNFQDGQEVVLEEDPLFPDPPNAIGWEVAGKGIQPGTRIKNYRKDNAVVFQKALFITFDKPINFEQGMQFYIKHQNSKRLISSYYDNNCNCGKVQLSEHCDAKGSRIELCTGEYDNTKVSGFFNIASHIKVPIGLKATIYDSSINNGRRKTIGPGEEWSFCNEDGWANDKIKSIKIEVVEGNINCPLVVPGSPPPPVQPPPVQPPPVQPPPVQPPPVEEPVEESVEEPVEEPVEELPVATYKTSGKTAGLIAPVAPSAPACTPVPESESESESFISKYGLLIAINVGVIIVLVIIMYMMGCKR
jgi:hypothetical protein